MTASRTFTCANHGLSHMQAAAFAAPTSETQQAVNAWLSENGITATALNPAGDWLSFSVPVSQANELFDADFTVFTHESTGKQAVRTLSYSIPADLQGHIDFVHPTTVYVWNLTCAVDVC